jgi:prepilin-type N-terminal cleavage/methylation domain-containing protein
MKAFVSRKAAGFTLIELMMSMVIMSIAFMGILPFFFYSQAQIKQSIITNIAILLIQEKMERILSLDYDLIQYDDFDGDPAKEYVYVLPERKLRPCITYGGCGYIPAPANILRDYVESQGYFFTRTIDIDQPDLSASLEVDDMPGGTSNLPPDMITKRVTIKVSWTVPGQQQQYVSATTQIADLQLPAFLN